MNLQTNIRSNKSTVNRSRYHGDEFTFHRGEGIRAKRVNRYRKLGMGVAAVTAFGALAVAARENNQQEDVLKNPPATTIVTAESGDWIEKMQREEGAPDGMSMSDAIHDAVMLNKAADTDNDPTIYPGDKVILIDNPDNNPQG